MFRFGARSEFSEVKVDARLGIWSKSFGTLLLSSVCTPEAMVLSVIIRLPAIYCCSRPVIALMACCRADAAKEKLLDSAWRNADTPNGNSNDPK